MVRTTSQVHVRVTAHVAQSSATHGLDACLNGHLHVQVVERQQLGHGFAGGDTEVDHNVTLETSRSCLSTAEALDQLGVHSKLLQHLEEHCREPSMG